MSQGAGIGSIKTALRFVAQALLYVPFMALVGYFSTSPAYRHLGADLALIRLSFSHAGQRVGECRQRTPEELAKLPPNMRAPLVCPRERSPVTVELDMDGQRVYRAVVPPSGLRRDLASTVYWRQPVAAGVHRFKVRLKDKHDGDRHEAERREEHRREGRRYERERRGSRRDDGGFNYSVEATLELKPGQTLVIDFNANRGGFLFK